MKTSDRPGRFQFRLRSLMALVTLASVFLGAGASVDWLRGHPWTDRLAALFVAVVVYSFLAFVVVNFLSIADGIPFVRKHQDDRPDELPRDPAPDETPRPSRGPCKAWRQVEWRRIIPFRW